MTISKLNWGVDSTTPMSGRAPVLTVPALAQRRIHWGPIAVHGLLLCLATIFLISAGPTFTLCASGSIVAPTFLILAYLEAKKEPLRITPISVYLFWNSFGLGFSAIFMGFKIAEGDWVDFSVATDPTR